MPKKPCREGYYRDKDGNCRRRSGYGGGALIYAPRRKKPKPDNGGNGEPTNGGGQPENGGPVQMVKLKDLLQNPLNRKIDRAKVDSIKSEIGKTKLIKPMVYTEIMTDKGKEKMLTDGHHRYVALKEMGYREAPVVMADGRGIATAQIQGMRSVKKFITTLRNFTEKQSRVGVTVPVVAKPTSPYSSPRTQTTQKHLQGQHDQSSHDPKTRGRAGATAGTVEAGAVHMATLAIPAIVVGALLRVAPRIGMGTIGVTAAFLLYEIPQLIFRMVEGGVRGYSGDRPYRVEQKKVSKAETVDVVGRTITRGDHMIVRRKDKANVGVSMGGDKVRLLDGKNFVDVKTTKESRIKISTEDVVPSTNPKDAKVTEQVLRQLIQEQNLLMTFADRAKHRQVLKHGSHNQKDHAPKGTGKAPDKAKELRAQLRPAFRASDEEIIAGKQGQIHADLIDDNPVILSDQRYVNGFVDEKGNFLTRDEASRRAGIRTSEELLDDKVTKHQQGKHNQASHDPTGGRGSGAFQQETRSRLRGSSSFKRLRRELQSLASNPNKPGNQERMDEIQEELSGQIRETRSQIRQEPKPAITTISHVKNHLGRGTKALLSAEQSNLSPKANAARTARLRQDLGAISNDVLDSDSRYGGSRERGFVASISASQAQELSNKYGQKSHIIIQGGKAQMKFREGSSMEGSVSEATERVGAEDDYSTIGGVKFTIPFKDREKEQTKKLLKQLAELRDSIAKSNRMNKEGVTAANVSGLGLVREDLQDEMAHPHPGRRRKGWTTQDNFRLSQKMDMDEGVDTKNPYKNPEGAQIEGGRV